MALHDEELPLATVSEELSVELAPEVLLESPYPAAGMTGVLTLLASATELEVLMLDPVPELPPSSSEPELAPIPLDVSLLPE